MHIVDENQLKTSVDKDWLESIKKKSGQRMVEINDELNKIKAQAQKLAEKKKIFKTQMNVADKRLQEIYQDEFKFNCFRETGYDDFKIMEKVWSKALDSSNGKEQLRWKFLDLMEIFD